MGVVVDNEHLGKETSGVLETREHDSKPSFQDPWFLWTVYSPLKAGCSEALSGRRTTGGEDKDFALGQPMI